MSIAVRPDCTTALSSNSFLIMRCQNPSLSAALEKYRDEFIAAGGRHMQLAEGLDSSAKFTEC